MKAGPTAGRDARSAATGRLLLAALALVAGFYALAAAADRWLALAWLAPLAIGIGLCVAGLMQGLQARAALRWSAVPAVVLESRVGEVFVPGKLGGYVEYFPIVRFAYTVAAGERESSRFSPVAQDYRDPRQAAVLELLAAYPPGAHVTAHVPPGDDAPAVLRREVSSRRRSQQLALAVAGLLVILVSLLVPLALRPA